MSKSTLNIVFVGIVAICIWNYSDLKPVISNIAGNFGNTNPTSEVDTWKQEAKDAFALAEKEILDVEPVPDVVGPHPDPNKCICKGSGIIVQGDGHKTPCPYHAKKHELLQYKVRGKNLIIKPMNISE